MIKLGNNITEIRLGSEIVKKAYLNNKLIYEPTIKFEDIYSNAEYVASTATGGLFILFGQEITNNALNGDVIEGYVKFTTIGNGKDTTALGNIFSMGFLDLGYFIRVAGTQLLMKGTNNSNIYMSTNPSNLTFGLMNVLLEKTFTITLTDVSLLNYLYVKNKGFNIFGQYTGSVYNRFSETLIYEITVKLNNTLMYNLIPVLEKSTNKYGLYDTVNKVFYTPTLGDDLVGQLASE